MPSDKIIDAIQLIHAGKLEEAQAELKQEILDHPEDEYAWIWYIETLPNLIARINVIQEFLRRFPENPKAQKVLRTLFAQQKNPLQATPEDIDRDSQKDHQDIPSAEKNVAPPPSSAPAPKPEPTPRQRARPKQKMKSTAPPKKKSTNKFLGVMIATAVIVAAYFGWQALAPSADSKDPIQDYAAEIKPVLDDLQAWNDGPIMVWGVRMQSKDSWGISTYEEDLQDPTLRVIRRDELIQVLIPLAEQIAVDGEIILEALQPLTPPEELLEAHQSIMVCVQFQIDKATVTAEFIRHDAMRKLASGACDNFTTAFNLIEEFTENDTQ